MSDEVRIEDHLLTFVVGSWGVYTTSLQGPSQLPAARLVLSQGSAVATR